MAEIISMTGSTDALLRWGLGIASVASQARSIVVICRWTSKSSWLVTAREVCSCG